MGYSTDFKGQLSFTKELTASQLAYLNTILGENVRDHVADWRQKTNEGYQLYYMDLKLTDDFSGIEWNGAEKTGSMPYLVNIVIDCMQDKWSDFGLEGELHTQGEDFDDRWTLQMENGRAVEKKVVIEGTIVECPHCEKKFVLEEQADEIPF